MAALNKTDNFFKHWNLYQKIIKNDYMSHNKIFEKIHDYMIRNSKKPYNMLEIGCGDAYHVCRHLTDVSPCHYCGVDMSQMALDAAKNNLEQAKFKNKILINSDLTSYLKNNTSTVDVILAGYCMHHLNYCDKQLTFDLCFDHLNDNGVFILYDLVRQQDESRKQTINRYMKNCRKKWGRLSQDELEAINFHMLHNDFPETQEDVILCLEKSRFKQDQIVTFENNTVALFIMTK